MSAEVPKLHHRLSLGPPAALGDRPPAEMVILIADPALFVAPRTSSPQGDERSVASRSMAFEAVHRFEFV
jgi:hypothetical protein